MSEAPVPGQNPKVMSLHFPGGAMMGIVPLTVLARLEELTAKHAGPVSDLFQNMEGGSVAAFLIAGMNTRKSNDPNSPDYDKPRHTIKEGLKLFIDETPHVFPDIPQRVAKMITGQWIDTAATMPPLKPLECAAEGFKAKLCNGFNNAAEGLQAAGRAAYVHTLGVPANYIRQNWAKDYMYDPEKLGALYKKVLGEDTRLSDVRGTIHLPVYNMSAKEVQFFTVEKNDLMKAASGNAAVSHGNPKLWEVAMAATANNLAYKPYIMGGQVYFDGAMFHEPTSHLDIAKKNGGSNVVLVDIGVRPHKEKSLADVMSTSKPFNNVVDSAESIAKMINQGQGMGPEQMSKVFGSAVEGATQGGLGHVRNYIQQTTARNEERDAFEKSGQVIRISPQALRQSEDPATVPGLIETFTATPQVIGKIVNYSVRTLQDQDPQIRRLAVELLANQVRLGKMSLQDYETSKKDIESQTFQNSQIPDYLRTISPDTQANPAPNSTPAKVQGASQPGS